MNAPGTSGSNGVAVVGDAGDRERALRGAVVGDRAADHLGLQRLADQLEVLLGELPRRLDGLATAAGEEHPVEVAGCVVRDPLGQVDRGRVRVGPEREVGQLRRLPGGRLGQLAAAVPHLHGEQAREPVEVGAALRVLDPAALTPHDDRRCARALAGEVHPEVVAGRLFSRGAHRRTHRVPQL